MVFSICLKYLSLIHIHGHISNQSGTNERSVVAATMLGLEMTHGE